MSLMRSIWSFKRFKPPLRVSRGLSRVPVAFNRRVSNSDHLKEGEKNKKNIEWKNKLFLAPLTTLGSLPFRRICCDFGADITCSPMILASDLLQRKESAWELVMRHESEKCFGVQLCGCNVEEMAKCAQIIQDEVHPDFIDINLCCPLDFIFKEGMGSALLRNEGAVEKMVSAMKEVVEVPVTLKIRAGIQNSGNFAHEFIKKAKLWDLGAMTVHGRSKEDWFFSKADWEYINVCAKEADPIPLFGSGDVLTYEEYNRHMQSTSVAGVMIGRGALIKPWIFKEIREQKQWDISSKDRFEILKKFTDYCLEYYGSDHRGVDTTRYFLLQWLSFLHRYIPVGLLETPQTMHQKPEPFVGRDILETLMASSDIKDWIAISEILLGKVGDNFEFSAKHLSYSWS